MGANVVFYSDLLFCFGYKKGKSMDKRTHLKQITLSLRANRSRRSFKKKANCFTLNRKKGKTVKIFQKQDEQYEFF